jgi:hypothetical protein
MTDAKHDAVTYTLQPVAAGAEPVVISIGMNGESQSGVAPHWARLEVEQCACCPLGAEHMYCPTARALANLMDDLGSLLSYDEVDTTVETSTRTMRVTVPAQKALSSILGLVMGTSGCPILARFMPMARFHLPFASTEETTIRSVGAYLIAQYFVHREGGEADWDLSGLKAFYNNVHTINKAMVARMREELAGDAAVNAVAILDLFAHFLPIAVDEQLAELRPLFSAFESPE